MFEPAAPRTDQRVALITGAADRIGASMARALGTAGFAVVIHYRNSAERAEILAAEIAVTGGRAAIVQADLTDRVERAELIGKAAQAFGPLTVLINNASVFEPDSIADIDEALWDTHFTVHVEAPVFLARDFAAQLPPGADGNIINMIDERVLHLTPAYLSYTLSKSALWTATRTLAQSLAPRIRVNAIGPGPTLAPAGQTPESFERAIASLPLQRGTTPDEIAQAVLFILSTPSMTGQMLALDGGRHLEWPLRRAQTPTVK
jgi:NAD(P)-dependent dehydrogenase (short-subunit alcohol dehydrogenase family)